MKEADHVRQMLAIPSIREIIEGDENLKTMTDQILANEQTMKRLNRIEQLCDKLKSQHDEMKSLLERIIERDAAENFLPASLWDEIKTMLRKL